MMTLPRPTSWYFEICRQILWDRLSFDKLFILYSDDALQELTGIWQAALRRVVGDGGFVDVAEVLDEKLQSDDRVWRDLVKTISDSVDMERAVEDYFLGDDAEMVITEIEGGGYRGK